MRFDRRFTTRAFWAFHEVYRPADHPVVRAWSEQVVRATLAAVSLPDDAVILDVGSGNGAFAMAWSKRRKVVALDYSRSLIEANPMTMRVEGSVFALPFADRTFDLVFTGATLHHVGDVIAALRELRRVSRSVVVALEPNRNNPAMYAFGTLVAEERGTLRFSPSWLRQQAASAGLCVRSCVAMGWIPPNKVPSWSLALLGRLPVRYPLGLHLLLVADRDQYNDRSCRSRTK